MCRESTIGIGTLVSMRNEITIRQVSNGFIVTSNKEAVASSISEAVDLVRHALEAQMNDRGAVTQSP